MQFKTAYRKEITVTRLRLLRLKLLAIFARSATRVFFECAKKMRIVVIAGSFHDFADGKKCFSQKGAGNLHPEVDDIIDYRYPHYCLKPLV